MGSSESKMVVSAPLKPEPAIKNSRVTDLMDPRSPSTGIDRTPIQVGRLVSKAVAEVKGECPLAFTDPRSPTVGIARTPVREVMRATVGSFARRLGMLFHNETEGKAPQVPQKHLSDAVEEEIVRDEELASTEPLLTPQPVCSFGSFAERTNPLTTPPLISMGGSSPFVLLEQPQVEVEVETEADISLEEAEEAKESPLHKRLSMSLITCHEGATSSQIYAEVHCDSTSSPVPSVETEPSMDGVDHCYALPSITVETESPVEPVPPTDSGDSPAQLEEPELLPSSEETKEHVKESSPAPAPSAPATNPSPEQPQLCTGIRCPTFDPKSPSQVVFKPQWLGKGFGATGLRARGVQGQGGKGGSSPLAVHVAIKNVTNENKGQSGKRKQKGTEGRSPLQILKETNSPRDQRPQMKLKVSTPDKQRFGQTNSKVLAVSLDKENR
ncbi:cell division cycle-associated protein 3 [Chaetodon auriga]|uniref:cell division cycle-associated protein 3 n=1 Tax=Chaetodon auriga TaxID=39042 RepID=UPI004032903C